jgi:hypothetical protein
MSDPQKPPDPREPTLNELLAIMHADTAKPTTNFRATGKRYWKALRLNGERAKKLFRLCPI